MDWQKVHRRALVLDHLANDPLTRFLTVIVVVELYNIYRLRKWLKENEQFMDVVAGEFNE